MPEWAMKKRRRTRNGEGGEEPIDLTISVSTKKIPWPSLSHGSPLIPFSLSLTLFPFPVVLFDYIPLPFSRFSSKRYVVGPHARTAQLFTSGLTEESGLVPEQRKADHSDSALPRSRSDRRKKQFNSSRASNPSDSLRISLSAHRQ